MLKDSLFKKIEDKTKVDKETIMNLANKIKKNNFKDENTLREVIRDLSNITGKKVSKEKEEKIISAIINDKVPNNIDKIF